MQLVALTCVVGAVVAALIGYALAMELRFDECGLSLEQAQETALKHVYRTDPSPDPNVKHFHSQGTCSYEFEHRGPAGRVTYIIYSTWLHGVKTSILEHDQDDEP